MTDKPMGRAKGGHARASKLTAEQRSEIARRGGMARHAQTDDGAPVPQATHGSSDHPLRIGDIEIPCYVLENETRVLSQRGLVGGLGMKYGTRVGGADRLTSFLTGKGISPHVTKDLLALIENPIKFRHTGGGALAFGYPATILADICDAILAARKAGDLQKQQEHLADRAEVLVRGFARVGIIALVDEATGYQRDRASDALAKILERFIAKELQPWIKTFPDEFYEHLFRLRGLDFPSDTVKRPQYFGYLTNDIVYKRLAPGVLDELKRTEPKTPSGKRKGTIQQRLTPDLGHPKLREHLASVTTIMALSDEYDDFTKKLDRRHPRYGETLAIDFERDKGKGKGL